MGIYLVMIDSEDGEDMTYYIVIREHDVHIVQAANVDDAKILADAHSQYDGETKLVYACDTAPQLIWNRDSCD